MIVPREGHAEFDDEGVHGEAEGHADEHAEGLEERLAERLDDEDDAVGGGGAVRAGHGHHRLAAYRREGAEEYGECEQQYFGRSARTDVRQGVATTTAGAPRHD